MVRVSHGFGFDTPVMNMIQADGSGEACFDLDKAVLDIIQADGSAKT